MPAYDAGAAVISGSAGAVFVEHLDPAADGEGRIGAVLRILEHQLAGGGPPLVAAVVLVRELQLAGLLVDAALGVAVLGLGIGNWIETLDKYTAQ